MPGDATVEKRIANSDERTDGMDGTDGIVGTDRIDGTAGIGRTDGIDCIYGTDGIVGTDVTDIGHDGLTKDPNKKLKNNFFVTQCGGG